MYDVAKIRNYILYLKERCGLFITLHPIKEENLIHSKELINFNIHDNPYCIYLKSFPEIQRHCIDRQQKVFKKCKDGSFCGCCFSGCFEYIYLISNGSDIIGFISVSGYKDTRAESYIDATAKKYSVPKENLLQAYRSLKDPPAKQELDLLILPLCDMLELAYIKTESGENHSESFSDRVLRYIRHYHTCNITLQDLCKQFSCDRFYISRALKKSTGKSFRDYLTALRIEDAKSLLLHSKLSITEISFSVGFNDSNYFSNVFKKQTGLSPRVYRTKEGQK